MANKYRGEIGFEADGKPYTLVFTMGSLYQLESKLGEPFGVVLASVSDMNKFSATRLRAVFWCGLQTHHKATIDEAGKIIDLIGVTEAARLVGNAVNLAFVGPENAESPLAAEPEAGPH